MPWPFLLRYPDQIQVIQNSVKVLTIGTDRSKHREQIQIRLETLYILGQIGMGNQCRPDQTAPSGAV